MTDSTELSERMELHLHGRMPLNQGVQPAFIKPLHFAAIAQRRSKKLKRAPPSSRLAATRAHHCAAMIEWQVARPIPMPSSFKVKNASIDSAEIANTDPISPLSKDETGQRAFG